MLTEPSAVALVSATSIESRSISDEPIRIDVAGYVNGRRAGNVMT